MARPKKQEPRIGKLPARYRFVLNPYVDVRCAVCPRCRGKTKLRKMPLLIDIDGADMPIILNKTCRYCPHCEIVIAHHDELEPLLLAALRGRRESLAPNDYLVLGTVERAAWRQGVKGQMTVRELVDNLHDFKGYLDLKVEGGWRPA